MSTNQMTEQNLYIHTNTDPQITEEQIKKIFEDFCEEDKTMDFGNFRMAVRMVQHTIGQNALK